MSDDSGYGKPPRKHQFQKGRSGNPRGRPPKNKNPRIHNADDLRRSWIYEVNQPVKIIQDGKELTMPAIAAIHRQLVMRALKGDPRAIRDVLRLTQPYYEKEDASRLEYWRMLIEAEEARKEADEKMSPYEREWKRYERFKSRAGARRLMGVERMPFEVDEPVDERDWQAYEKHLDDLKHGRPTRWPPKYWDDEGPDS